MERYLSVLAWHLLQCIGGGAMYNIHGTSSLGQLFAVEVDMDMLWWTYMDMDMDMVLSGVDIDMEGCSGIPPSKA